MLKIFNILLLIQFSVYAEYRNCISAVIGVPDFINFKYTRMFDKLSFGLNTGLNPTLPFPVPGLDAGYRIFKHGRYSVTATFMTSYWPEMAICDAGARGIHTETIEDWLHLSLRPDVNIDLKRIRITLGIGYDQIVVIDRPGFNLNDKPLKPFYSAVFACGYMF